MIFTKRSIIFSTLSFLAIYFLLTNIGKDGDKCAENNSFPFSKAKVELINTRKDLRKEFYTILEYTKFFGQHKFCQHELDGNLIRKFENNDKFNKIFSSNSKKNNGLKYNYLDNCEYKNCFFTCNANYVDIVDGVIFSYDYFFGDFENKQIETKKLMQKRSQNQIWMVWNDEADLFRINMII